MKLVYTISGDELLQAVFVKTEPDHRYRRNKRIRTLLGVGLFCVVAVGLVFSPNVEGWPVWFVFGTVLLGYLIFNTWDDRTLMMRAWRDVMKRSKMGDGPKRVKMELFEEHLLVDSGGSRLELKYAAIERLEHLADVSFIYSSPLVRQVVCTGNVEHGDASVFFNELARKCRDAMNVTQA